MKNPKWHRDEIILALNLYFDPDRGSIDARNSKVIRLSEILKKLPIFFNRPDADKFRNPNGVSLKLSNFLAIDPNHSGKGMEAYSKLDKEIFEEFFQNKEKLRKIASQIIKITENDRIKQNLYAIEDDENTIADSVKEGQVLYKLHKYRERNSKIVSMKKKESLKTLGKLSCEVCDFDFHESYGELGLGFIECHHTKPLSEIQESMETRLQDLALVCANCHRMLHRSIGVLTIKQLSSKLKRD